MMTIETNQRLESLQLQVGFVRCSKEYLQERVDVVLFAALRVLNSMSPESLADDVAQAIALLNLARENLDEQMDGLESVVVAAEKHIDVLRQSLSVATAEEVA